MNNKKKEKQKQEQEIKDEVQITFDDEKRWWKCNNPVSNYQVEYVKGVIAREILKANESLEK